MLLKNPIHLYYRCGCILQSSGTDEELYTSISCHCKDFLFSLNCDEDCLYMNNGITASFGDVINAGSFPAKHENFFRAIKEFIEIFQEYKDVE